ncbi:glycosyltransferase family 4 protein [Pseudoxanthomonas sp. F37]|uniref:glycosyltransferase family 4 protein n=1 Tax=Pseudoxanthomonas TaxID=83618 RepID=UPI001FD18883|nr:MULTISPECIES: glycosyltransferase family 1 protein [Pseudoxanthomonas]UOV06585.1 glycosyltransferase family 4 protein [Pseudoxanthomonas mexicana]UOV08192.1 glycosyltransferase family 4 protein [Pseudoxanthomonas sp. F37]
MAQLHIVLDLQACQSPESGRRGIGRYSLSLAKAIAASPRGHRISILLNSAMPERLGFLRAQFQPYLPDSDIIIWRGLAKTGFIPAENAFRRRASEVLRRQMLRSLAPDVVHVASVFEGVADDVVSTLSESDPYINVVTLYDLIPLVHRQSYLADQGVRAWYMARLEQFRAADQMLGISQFSCEEAIGLLGVEPDRVTNILGAADEIFRREEPGQFRRDRLLARYGIERPFVMYAGGFDSRKNISALVRAFAMLPDGLRTTHQLVIVGQAPASERLSLEAVVAECGLGADNVVFAGFVADADLVGLYNQCRLYAFPSLQEGFGLPALEAMSSGAVVIGSNCSSLPEVIGMEEALFDPTDDVGFSLKLRHALTDEDFRQRFLAHALLQVKRFSWEASASLALDGMERAYERKCSASSRRKSQEAEPDMRAHGQPYAWLPAPGGREDVPDGAVVVLGDVAAGLRPACQHRLSELADWASEIDRFVVEVTDSEYCAKTLMAARAYPADLVVETGSIGRLWAELARLDRAAIAEVLYRYGGYPALAQGLTAGYAADALATLLPVEALELVGRCQLIRTDRRPAGVIPGWRDEIRQLAGELVRDKSSAYAGEGDWARFAQAWVANRNDVREPRWFVDITNLAVRDAGTGIQRVVRHMLDELMHSPPVGYRIEPVSLGDDGIFRYARSYCARRYFSGEELPEDGPVEFASGDVYLGLDLVAHLVPAYVSRFRQLSSQGVRQYFVVYDLLPLLRPDCFESHLLPLFRAWYEAVAEVSDGVLCISKAVADEFEHWLHQSRPERQNPLRIGWFHLGADLDGSSATRLVAPPSVDDDLAALSGRVNVLMVGTIEPRKGHAQALAAFEQLWQQGAEINLVLIGRPGWLVEDLVARIANHPERDRRLFWFDEAGDVLLLEAYRRASALLMASEGEGYGLPLIEAARHGVPLIARDLPVFREVAGDHAHYFSGYDAGSLSAAVQSWLTLYELGEHPKADGITWASWATATRQLVGVISEGQWVHQWLPGPVRQFAATDYRLKSEVGCVVRGRLETRGREGILLYGPYVPQAAGDYRLEVEGTGTGGGWLDVCSGSGTTVHFVQPFALAVSNSEDGLLVGANFVLPNDVPDLEIRISVRADTRLSIAALRIIPCAAESESRC